MRITNINNNIAFLEDYKALDAFCKDMFANEPSPIQQQFAREDVSGITEYIRRMDATPVEDRKVKNWDEVVRGLVSLRRIRNNLVHVVGTLEQETATARDIQDLRSYLEMFRKHNDPLTCLKALSEKQDKGSLWSRLKRLFTGKG